jgi:hypothetical protein
MGQTQEEDDCPKRAFSSLQHLFRRQDFKWGIFYEDWSRLTAKNGFVLAKIPFLRI